MRNEWRIKLLLPLILLLAVYMPIIPEMVGTWWRVADSSHCFLIPFISGFLIWRKRKDIAGKMIESSNWGLLTMSSSLLLYVICLAGDVAVGARVAMVFTLIGLVLYNFGGQVLRLTLFPLLFLFFMVPVPDSVLQFFTFPMQLFAARMSMNVLNGLSIPVLQEGNMLHFASTSFEVAPACSGLRSMTAYLTLGALFAYLSSGPRWGKMMLVLSSVPIALVVNIMRVSGTGAVAYFYGEKIARGFLHDFSGILVFTLGLFAFLSQSRLLDRLAAHRRGETPVLTKTGS